MKKLTTLFVTCILVLSLSGIALADGGATHGPGLATYGPPVPTPSLETGTDNQYYAAASEIALLMAWLEQSIL
jgi:hypothetical protein